MWSISDAIDGHATRATNEIALSLATPRRFEEYRPLLDGRTPERNNGVRQQISMNTPGNDAKQEPPHVIVRGNANGFLQEVVSGRHHLQADEPAAAGGNDAAPGPYDYLLIALGVCTSMTVGFYARRKQIPLENIVVSLSHSRIHAKDCEECETKVGMLDRIDLKMELTGPLTQEQHVKLVEIAGKCPVHRTLKSEINIRLRGDQAM